MKGIWDDSDGARNVSSDELSSDKNERDGDYNVQFTEIGAVVLKRRWLV